ncbi:hypothetical protein B7494_g4419 [Chlorociboria aeruginascens]|nr:hypothetical protein B7494_g4419 [Chlorociboria aeruginascens]
MASSSDRDRDGKGDQSKLDGPFIKFRQFADAQVGSLLQGIVGLPSAFSTKPKGDHRSTGFDDDLRRRDELQARRKELADAQARADGDGEVPVDKPSAWNRGAPHPESSSNDRLVGSKEPANPSPETPWHKGANGLSLQDLPLYSPISKDFLSHLDESSSDWKRYVSKRGISWFDEIHPLAEELEASFKMLSVHDMSHVLLKAHDTYRSQSSLLPYLLLSPYSPIELSFEKTMSDRRKMYRRKMSRPLPPRDKIDDFPYLEAFEDLLLSSHGRPLAPTPSRMVPLHAVGPWDSICWIGRLYRSGLLDLDGKYIGKNIGPGLYSRTDRDSKDIQTEQDMYDLFLRWASAPNTVGGSLESFLAATENVFQQKIKDWAQQGINKDRNETSFTDSHSFIAKQIKEMEEVKREKTKDPAPISKSEPQSDPEKEKVVSRSTTSEQMTYEDGSVETTVTIWKRFADGRESETITTHIEDPTSVQVALVEQVINPKALTIPRTQPVSVSDQSTQSTQGDGGSQGGSTRILTASYPHVSGEFTLFTQLPLVVQEKIWNCTLPGPRNIEIYGRDLDNELIIRPDTHSSIFRVKSVSTTTWKLVLQRYDEIPAYYLGLRVFPLKSTVLINWEKDAIFPNGVELSNQFLLRLDPYVEMRLQTVIFDLQHLEVHLETVTDDLLDLNNDVGLTHDLFARLYNVETMVLWVLVYDLETALALPGSNVEFLRFRDRAFEPRAEQIVTQIGIVFRQLRHIKIVFADMKRRGEPPISKLLTNPIIALVGRARGLVVIAQENVVYE